MCTNNKRVIAQAAFWRILCIKPALAGTIIFLLWWRREPKMVVVWKENLVTVLSHQLYIHAYTTRNGGT
ncbi:hypothetical protein VTG60DRAFT_2451 [Thermothelomyces hinnuleus]